MRNFFPSTFPPKKMWCAFYPWEQSRVISGQGQGNRVSNSLFQNTSVGYVHLTEMPFKIPCVVVLCPWRSYLIESYWSYPYWLTCPPHHDVSPSDTGDPGSSHKPTAHKLCDSAPLLCVFLWYFPCNSAKSCLLNPTLYVGWGALCLVFSSGSHGS